MIEIDNWFLHEGELDKREGWKAAYEIMLIERFIRLYIKKTGGTFDEFCKLFGIDIKMQEKIRREYKIYR